MGQCGAGQREKPKQGNHRQGYAQDEALRRFRHAYSPFERSDERKDRQNENHGVVIEKLASQFGAESTEIKHITTHATAMKAEAYKVVFQVPIQDGDTTKGRNQ